MKNVKRIDLVFENCEVAELYPNMFTSFICGEITDSYWINCFQHRKGEVNRFLTCKYFTITINKKGLKQRTKMGTYLGSVLKERLNHKDITHVDIIFKKINLYIAVPWERDNPLDDLQKHTIDKDGLIIEIKEK